MNADTGYLLKLARDKSKRGREKLGESISDLFSGSASTLTDRERNHMFAILHQLIREAEMTVRRSISARLADNKELPPDLAKILANDEIEVAYPILSRSPVLQDHDLVEVIRQRTLEHQLAVAVREAVSEEVSGALVEAGNLDVIVSLLNNHGADISQKTMRYLVEESKRVDTFHEPLLHRQDLEADLAKRMCLWVSAALRQYVVENFDVDESAFDDLLETAALEEIDAATSQGLTPSRTEVLAKELAAAGEISPSLLIRLIGSGQVHLFIAMIEEQTGLRRKLITRILLEPGGEGLAILCKAIGFERNDFDAVFSISRKAKAHGARTLKQDRRKALTLFDQMSEDAAKAVVRRWCRNIGYLAAVRELEVGSSGSG